MKLLPVFDALRNESLKAMQTGWIVVQVRVTPLALAGSVVALPIASEIGSIDRLAEILVNPQDFTALSREWSDYGDGGLTTDEAVEQILGMPVVS